MKLTNYNLFVAGTYVRDPETGNVRKATQTINDDFIKRTLPFLGEEGRECVADELVDAAKSITKLISTTARRVLQNYPGEATNPTAFKIVNTYNGSNIRQYSDSLKDGSLNRSLKRATVKQAYRFALPTLTGGSASSTETLGEGAGQLTGARDVSIKRKAQRDAIVESLEGFVDDLMNQQTP